MHKALRRCPSFVLAAVALGVGLALAPATPAAAHDVGGVGATNFATTLSDVTPAVAGLTLRVVENGSRLELRNDTDVDAVVSGYGGEPYARVGPDGAWVNDDSPATYLNGSRFSNQVVPPDADGKGEPRWRKVGDESVWRWHDHRVHWMLTTLPPSVAADPSHAHRISEWSVVVTYGDQRLTATGTLDWIPGPSPWPWLVLVLLVAAGTVAATRLARPHRWLAVATALMLATDLAHGLGAALVSRGTFFERVSLAVGSEGLLVWPIGLLAGWLLWRGSIRAAWLAAGIGIVLGVTMVLDDAPAWWRSSAPTALPFVLNRTAVALVVGLSVGLVVALPLLVRLVPARTPSRRIVAIKDSFQAPDPEAEAEAEPEPGAEAEAEAGPEVAPAGIGRRQVAGLLAAGAVGAFAGATVAITAQREADARPDADGLPLKDVGDRSVPFRGGTQAGITAPDRPQSHAWVAGFDLEPGVSADALRGLLRRWTEAAERLTAGRPLGGSDDAVVTGLGPAALTVTVGFGPSLFGQAGVALTARPEALAPLPAFDGERLDPARGDGDLGVVVAADDPVVVAHAARVLRRLATGTAHVRWQLRGFNAARGSGPDAATPRNLMGQVDGTNNPRPSDPDFSSRILVTDGPAWLRGGSFLVVRRIRMLLDAWDGLDPAAQERVIGRRRDSGAPLTGGGERTAANLGARTAEGELVIPADAHMRLAAPAENQGAAMLRRGFSYVDGDEAGLLFLAWQADPRRGFIPVQRRLVAGDALGRFIRHETSALFAMPGGVGPGAYLGQGLVEP